MAHLYFSPHRPTLKNPKEPPSQRTKTAVNMDGHHFDRRERTTGNTGLAKVAVQYSADIFVVNQSWVLRMNICS